MTNEPWQRPLSVETIRELERQSAQLQELQRELEAQTTIADPLAAVRALVRNQGGHVEMAKELFRLTARVAELEEQIRYAWLDRLNRPGAS